MRHTALVLAVLAAPLAAQPLARPAHPPLPAHGDGNETTGPVQGGLRALDAVWPDDPGIRMATAGGITTANIMPGSGNTIGGATVYVKFRGRTIEEMRITDAPVLGGLK